MTGALFGGGDKSGALEAANRRAAEAEAERKKLQKRQEGSQNNQGGGAVKANSLFALQKKNSGNKKPTSGG